MSERTPYSRSPESNSREISMRKEVAPLVLKNLGEIISDRKVSGMQMITVQPSFAPPIVAWVKCAWKPGDSGNCAVQMAFPSKKDRAHTADDVVNVVVEKTKRARGRGATHLLLLAADNAGHKPLAAYMLPIDQVSTVVKEAVAVDESLTRNGASPSIYITANGERQVALVEIVKKYSIDLLRLPEDSLTPTDAIDDLNVWPPGVVAPEKTNRMSASYSRDPRIRSFVINRAKGCCEYCGEQGFLTSDGKNHYVEAHHIIALADDGEDTVKNVIALCPKHHREAHFGASRTTLEAEMVRLLKPNKERER
jgi:predicted HNH restriction endonuclease